MKKTISRIVLTSALAFGALSTVYAHGYGHGSHHQSNTQERAERWLAWGEALQTKLNLNDNQKQLWKNSQEKRQALQEARRDLMKQKDRSWMTKMGDEGFDLKAHFDAQNANSSKLESLKTEWQSAQIEFFNALSVEQRKTMADEFKALAEQRQQRHNNHHGAE